jgi:hypothetical protein
MRGTDERSGELFSYVDLEARVRRDHPLRAIRLIANEALGALTKDFAALYALEGRTATDCWQGTLRRSSLLRC